ncbi:MAG: hypothetical protein L6Q66_13500 [Bacteroidia bacterium]|nr:hypothetical protein [Bacteroidia bacterium]
MIATVEISMYALTDGYAEKVIDFIQRVKKHPGIKVEVNGLSTQLFGEYDHLMDVLKKEMRTDFENGKAVFLLKLAGSELTKDKLPEILK